MSDEKVRFMKTGLLRFARNDVKLKHVIARSVSDEAIQGTGRNE
jgi:hypothetical protein